MNLCNVSEFYVNCVCPKIITPFHTFHYNQIFHTENLFNDDVTTDDQIYNSRTLAQYTIVNAFHSYLRYQEIFFSFLKPNIRTVEIKILIRSSGMAYACEFYLKCPQNMKYKQSQTKNYLLYHTFQLLFSYGKKLNFIFRLWFLYLREVGEKVPIMKMICDVTKNKR